MSRTKWFGVVAFAVVISAVVPTSSVGAIVPPTWSAIASTSNGYAAIGTAQSRNGEIAGNGRFVAFESVAGNLVPGVSGRQVYRKDHTTGRTTVVSATGLGVAGNNASRDPSISFNGRYVAFYSIASNLVAGDTNGVADVFVKDLDTGSIVRASTDGAGGQVLDSGSFFPAVSNNGSIVTFTSLSSQYVAGDTNKKTDVFVKNITTNGVVRASTDGAGAEGNGPAPTNARYPSMTGDGRYVVFESGFDNLVPNDTNETADIFWKDTISGQIRLLSASSSGVLSDGTSRRPSIARTGRFVAFTSLATNLVAGDAPGTLDVFMKDLLTNAVTWITTDSAGVPGNDTSSHPELSAVSNFGREVAFASRATNLVAGDGNDRVDVFVKDTATGATTRVSEAVGGGDADDWSANPSINQSGSRIAFESAATNMVIPATAPLIGQVYRAST